MGSRFLRHIEVLEMEMLEYTLTSHDLGRLPQGYTSVMSEGSVSLNTSWSSRETQESPMFAIR